MAAMIPDDTAPPARRAGTLVALGVTPVLLVGAALLMGIGGDPATLSTDTEPATTTTVVAPTTSPVFVDASSTITPPSLAAAPATTPATLATTTLPPTTTIPPTTVPETLPRQETQPIAPPPDPRGYEDQILLGSIAIPKLGVDEPLFEGIRLTTLDNGPGHWPGTAMPGQIGNVVVAAHRTSHGGPFRHIDQLVAGDVVQFTTDAGLVEYTVTGTQIVGPDAMWIVDPSDTPTATLFACHPPGSTRQRIVVHLELS